MPAGSYCIPTCWEQEILFLPLACMLLERLMLSNKRRRRGRAFSMAKILLLCLHGPDQGRVNSLTQNSETKTVPSPWRKEKIISMFRRRGKKWLRGCWYFAHSSETTFFTASTYICFLEMVAICFILEMPEVENHSPQFW